MNLSKIFLAFTLLASSLGFASNQPTNQSRRKSNPHNVSLAIPVPHTPPRVLYRSSPQTSPFKAVTKTPQTPLTDITNSAHVKEHVEPVSAKTAAPKALNFDSVAVATNSKVATQQNSVQKEAGEGQVPSGPKVNTQPEFLALVKETPKARQTQNPPELTDVEKIEQSTIIQLGKQRSKYGIDVINAYAAGDVARLVKLSEKEATSLNDQAFALLLMVAKIDRNPSLNERLSTQWRSQSAPNLTSKK